MGKTKKKTRRSAHPLAQTLDPSAPSPAEAASELATEATAELSLEPKAAIERQGRLEATLGRASLWLAALFLALFVVVATMRLRYPFVLEWIEGGMLDEMRWLLAGNKLYVRPSLDYVPFIYNPLYFWVCAAVAKVFGATLLTMRLVSFASALGAMGLLYALVVKETQDAKMGVLAAGLYAATFKVTEQFMDIARVDSLFVVLALASLWVLRAHPTAKGRAIAAGLLVLCFLAKQSGMFVAAPLVLFVLRDAGRGAKTTAERMRGVPFAAIVASGILGSVWLLDASTDGWYRYFAFELPSGHFIVPEMWTDFWTVDLMGTFGCACVGALFVLLGPSGMERRLRELWGAALAGVLLCSWSGRLHDGGWTNVLMPAFAILAALFAIALHAGIALARSAGSPRGRRFEGFVALIGLIQLAMLIYDPRAVVPKERDEAAGRQIVAALRDASGDVFLPTDSYLTVMAGKRPHLHQMAVDDITRAPESDTGNRLRDEIRAAFGQRRWAMVVTDNDFFEAEVLANYKRGPESVRDPDAFYPVTGVHYRPGWMYTPK